MPFKFKVQRYQTDAARAVTDVFTGQPNQGAAVYVHDAGRVQTHLGMESLFGGQGMLSEGYGNASVVLTREQLLDNVRRVQRRNGVPESVSLAPGPGAVTLDIYIENATGKTYVYTKTMLELNRLYGWSKFIIVVPSIAIREGVYQSLKNTEQHFFEQYGRAIRYFVYDSHRLTELDSYAQSSDINAMIINMQAFNTSMKEGGRSREARIMYSERDEFGSRRPIDVLAANHPIVIQDEPQKMGGKATQEGIARFQPLFCLNYSATHKERHDLVYALDALDAYNQRLVKRIEVKGFELKNELATDGYLYLQDILVSATHAPRAVIEYRRLTTSGSTAKRTGRFEERDDIYAASGELEAYREGFTIAEIVPDAFDGQLGYVRFVNGIVLRRGEVHGDSAEHDMRRVQIRETIRSHLEKEEALFARGVKCLSLFFIDEVAKYRQYDEDGNEVLGEYGRIFEEEYARAVEILLQGQQERDGTTDSSRRVTVGSTYHAYLEGIDAHDTHKGYFSIDKKGRSIDSKVKRGSEESDDESAYDLILRDKERLLSFEEPCRFIFSHSALREGWDNPNVFQICTLKRSDSETGKRQEVGRGLRLCVNQGGERQDADVLGDTEVQRVNTLTVIASESYADFVSSLQTDISQALRERPKKVDKNLFSGFTIEPEDGAPYTFTEEDADEIMWALIRGGLIDRHGAPTERFREEGAAALSPDELGEHLYDYIPQIAQLVKSVYDRDALSALVGNGHASKVRGNALNANFRRREFQELWAKINAKHSYTVRFDDEELREHAIKRINKDLIVGRASYAMSIGVQRSRQTRSDLAAGDSFERTSLAYRELEGDGVSVTYELLGEISRGAAITRRSAAAILKGMSSQKFALFRVNPEEFIARVSKLIVAEKARMIVEHIEYHRLDDHYDADIFMESMPESMSRALSVRRCVQDYVFCDSERERRFARDLDDATDTVAVYAKLPRGFTIPTPVGNYAPDWAIAFMEGSVRHVYFIAETKGTLKSSELREVESSKIACATKLFNELSDSDVRYGVATNYDDLLTIVNGTA